MGRRSITTSPFHPYLQSLLAAQVPADEILRQAEALGADPRTLVEIAGGLLPHLGTVRNRRMVAACLAFGSVQEWVPLLPMVRTYIPDLLETQELRSFKWEQLMGLIDLLHWEAFFRRLLLRLGHGRYLQPRTTSMNKTAAVSSKRVQARFRSATKNVPLVKASM